MKSRSEALPPRARRRLRRVAGCAVLLVVGCSVYDPALVEPLDDRASNPGTRVDGGQVPDPGEAVCGDGRVSGAEKCDTGIAQDKPGACPTTCEGQVACVDRVLDGGGCQVECVEAPRACEAGDGCCPAGCMHASDADCSQNCGDGVVQREEGETCEPGSEDDPCPTDCDDGDACSTDALTGSEGNCNVECSNTAITALAGGDGCCPEGATANGDEDCMAECGNGVLEPGEDCDGSEGCEDDCTQNTLTPAQEQCLGLFDPPDECEACSCMACTDLLFACYDSGSPEVDATCIDVHECARANQCTGDPCYCGTLGVVTCWLAGIAPPGPCVAEMNAASNSTNSGMFQINRTNPDFPVYDAEALRSCSVMNCPSVCP